MNVPGPLAEQLETVQTRLARIGQLPGDVTHTADFQESIKELFL